MLESGDLDRGYLEVSQQPLVDSLAASFDQHLGMPHRRRGTDEQNEKEDGQSK